MHYHAKAVKLKMAKVLKIAAAQKWTGLQDLKIEFIWEAHLITKFLYYATCLFSILNGSKLY